MPHVEMDMETEVAPEDVTAALLDFTPRRPEIWPGLTANLGGGEGGDQDARHDGVGQGALRLVRPGRGDVDGPGEQLLHPGKLRFGGHRPARGRRQPDPSDLGANPHDLQRAPRYGPDQGDEGQADPEVDGGRSGPIRGRQGALSPVVAAAWPHLTVAASGKILGS